MNAKKVIFLIASPLILSMPTVTAVPHFATQGEGIFWILMFGVWLALLFMTFTIKGLSNKPVGWFNVLQMLVSIVIGFQFFKYSMIIAIGVMFSGLGIFIGMMYIQNNPEMGG